MKEKEIQRLADLLANKIKENQEKSNQEVLKQLKKAKEKKKDVKVVSYKVVQVASESGDVSPSTPIGVNLPNKYKLLKNICSNNKIYDLIDLLDRALVVFSVKLNEDKQNVYRLFNTGLNVNEEFIPKKDETGNWIDFGESFDHKVVDLDSEFIPDEVSYEMILEKVIDQIKGNIDYYKKNEIFNYEGDLDESELEKYLDEVVDDIKNEIVV